MRSAKVATRISARARVSARVPKHVQSRLAEAAGLVGATVNQFVLQAALKEADEVIERERVIRLSRQDSLRLLELMDNPPPPNAKLARALQRHRDFMSSGQSN